MEARIRLAAARRELADAVNDATTGIGCLTCDDPQTMNHIRACWRGIPTTKSSCSEEDSVPDERIEKAAIAIFAAQTNWAEPNPTQKTGKALWDGQMDAVRDSFRRLAKAALDSLEDRPADLDWENAEPKELDNRLVEAVTKGGTIVRGRTVAVQGSLDQLIVEGVLQPLLIRFPGEHWRLANGWTTLNFYKREADSGLHRP